LTVSCTASRVAPIASARLSACSTASSINGGADALGGAIKELGQSFREIQTGRVQNYMLLVLLMTIIIFILFEIPLPGLR